MSDYIQETVDQLKQDEGFKECPYHCTSGKLSIGYGWNLDAGITKSEAEFILKGRVLGSAMWLHNTFPWFDGIAPEAKEVLINMAYNLGNQGLLKFKNMLSLIKTHEYSKAADEIMDSLYATQVPTRAARLAQKLREII